MNGRKNSRPPSPFRRQRIIQALSLLLFFWLLRHMVVTAAEPALPPDLFLRLDPLAAPLLLLTARDWLPEMWPGLAVLGATFLAGRFFCGYICPFGGSLDFCRILLRKLFGTAATRPGKLDPAGRKIKYLLLAALAGTALPGVNLFYWGAPLPLIARFYALLIHPLLLLASNQGLALLGPLLAGMSENWVGLQYLQILPRGYHGLFFLLGFFGLAFGLELFRPRFWCRYLCPAGALLGLCSRRSPLRRRVQECVNCGKCAAICPMSAISQDGRQTGHGECLGCRTCAAVCPVKGIAFSPAGRIKSANSPAALPERRAFLGAAGVGVLVSGATLARALPGLASGAECLRPPGSLPENEFLRRCLRCGACMKICPSNGLQPAWAGAGLPGLFSPLLLPRRGPCEPDCNACGRVCPSQAILRLPLAEKRWAKLGTAAVKAERCLALAEGKRCVVCQEVCPYGAVKLVQASGQGVPVPVVAAERCFGCGYCEKHCPVQAPAIAVYPAGALRLERPDYEMAARAAGLDLVPVSERRPDAPDYDDFGGGGLPPGFTD
ncbi:MAG: 4Fe-4S dicluster domain-containing protein [Deltaproteobacteria bacterium]|jgi:MauM/NapG family ferredoxin protein|nr:4Fe-4S dicluster domain-containing protein [Deltaproteobacteria bacterium]